MKIVNCFILLIAVQSNCFAQKEFWGTTNYGGNASANGYGFGTIFRTDSAGQNPVVVHRFDSVRGMKPSGALFMASNGKIYGTASEGGFTDIGNNQGGTLFEYDPVIDSFKTAVYFLSSQFPNYSLPRSGVIEPVPGLLYGTAGGGGTRGVIFKYDINNGIINFVSQVPSFQSQLQLITNWLNGSLMKASNGILYGATQQYSSCPSGFPFLGSVASVNLSNNAFAYVYPFNCTYYDGANPNGGLVEGGVGKLYGTTTVGGLNYTVSPIGDGSLFEYNYLTNTFTRKASFDSTLGASPTSIVLGPNNKLYGVCTGGGSGSLGSQILQAGTLFKYDPVTNTLSKRKDFGYDASGHLNGYQPSNPLLYASNGYLYGYDQNVGIFEYNTANDTVILKSRWSDNQDFFGGGASYSGALIEICRKPSYKYFYTDSISSCRNNPFSYTVHSNNATTYKWNHNGIAIPAQTDSTLQLFNLALSDSGAYTCTMTNQCGQTTTMKLVLKVDSCIITPVYWLHPLTATLINNKAELKWSLEKTGNEKVLIERSVDGIVFTELTNMSVASGSLYNYIDGDIISGTIYYRIKVKDDNGKFVYSNIVHVNIQGLSINIFPNPANSVLYITGIEKVRSVRIYNSHGQMVLSKTNIQTLNISSLSKGLYIIAVETISGTTKCKFEKQ